jgi:hypothetical protein
VANPDFDALLNPLLGFAQQMLAKHGAFYPTITSGGRITLAAADSGGDDQPEPAVLIEVLVAGFREQAVAGAIRAAGPCLDVRVVPPNDPETSDAICVQLEHAGGECVDLYLPYRKDEIGRPQYGEIFTVPREARTFREDP